MNRVIQAGGLWLAIAAIVWLATLWRWQTDNHDASHGEIVGQLFLLPLMLMAAVLAALWGVGRLREMAAPPLKPSALPPAAQRGEAALATASSASDESLHALTAWILAEAVHLPAGDEAGAVWAAIHGRAQRPTLDAELQDVDGAPVMAARVAGLDTEGWLASWEGELETKEGEPLSPGVVRGLALLEAPLSRLLRVIGELVPCDVDGGTSPLSSDSWRGGDDPGDAADPKGAMKAHLSGMVTPVSLAVRGACAARAPHLTVRLLLPSHWREVEREAAVACLRKQCGPLLDWAEAAGARGVTWRMDVPVQPELFWSELDQLMLGWSSQPSPELMLVLAVDSALTPQGIERMQAKGELFTAMHQSGRMPGEGAAGLLLANTCWHEWCGVDAAGEPGLGLPHHAVRMWRPLRARRDKSADAMGRVGCSALHSAFDHAATLGRIDAGRVLIVADADHRASRAAELFEALQEAMPGVDPMLSVVRVGESCGELGMARALVPTALASAALRAGGLPESGTQEGLEKGAGVGGIGHALAVHLQSPHDRVVVALAPWRPAAASRV